MRIGTEVIDAWAKDHSTKYTGPGKPGGNNSELNRRLRACGLEVVGLSKRGKCYTATLRVACREPAGISPLE